MLLTAIVCLISALASGSDGTGVLGERVCKDVKPFSALNISNCCNVVYEQGDEYKVRVVAEKALLDSIADIADCKVVGGMLVVSVKNVNAGFLSSLERVDFKHGEVFVNGVPYVRVRKEVTVYVTAPNINRFLCQGNGSLRVDKMDADNVEFFVSDAGSLRAGKMDTDNVEFFVSGAGSVDIKQLNANDATFHVAWLMCVAQARCCATFRVQAALSSQAQRLNSIRLCRAADLYIVASFAVRAKRLQTRTRRAAKASVLCSAM